MLTRLEIAGLSLSRGERRLFGGLSFALSAGEAAAQAVGAIIADLRSRRREMIPA